MIITNTRVQQSNYLKSDHIRCITVTELVEMAKEVAPTLSDHLNIASIESAEMIDADNASAPPANNVSFPRIFDVVRSCDEPLHSDTGAWAQRLLPQLPRRRNGQTR